MVIITGPDLRMEVLLELQLLLEGLKAILSIHPPQHLILQLLSGIRQAGVKLIRTRAQNNRLAVNVMSFSGIRGLETEQGGAVRFYLCNLRLQVPVFCLEAALFS